MSIKEKTMQVLQGFRCSDISDAMDGMGLQGLYHMNPAMRPMVPGTRFIGIARTMEFVPVPENEKLTYTSYEEFERLQYLSKYEGGYHFYDNIEKGIHIDDVLGYLDTLTPGDVVVTDCHGLVGGVWGSDNCHGLMINHGVVGFVLDGYMRDTPEAIAEGVPVFSTGISFIHPMGRLQIGSYGEEVHCGGVKVRPGDIVCADHDGIMIIPEEYADEVAYRFYKIQQIDRINRRNNYIKSGKELDATVELLPDLECWF